MKQYRDLREHLQALEDEGLLQRVSRPINKDTELFPLVRWQFRGGIAEHQRRGWLFENVIDSNGTKYPYPFALGVLASSRRIYGIGLNCRNDDEILAKWQEALTKSVSPIVVDRGPVQEVQLQGEALSKKGGGFESFPVPISTPGFDNGPYFTWSHWVTKDPETGIRNLGNYRAQIKSPTRLGISLGAAQHAVIHWRKCRERKMPLEAAIIVGCPPVVSYACVQKIPYSQDEYDVAGGLVGEPIQLVKCKTVDVEVPAHAELVIEGRLPTDFLEPEGPFGESHGYMHPRQLSPYLEVTCVTHRKDVILSGIMSQVTPSESSTIKKVGYDTLFLKYLREHCGLKNVTRVVMHEALVNLRKLVILQVKKSSKDEIRKALHAAVKLHGGVGKITIAVDEDIDPESLDGIFWALCFRATFPDDIEFLPNMSHGHAPPFPKDDILTKPDAILKEAYMLVDATLKEPFPPVSLPRREFMERAAEIWKELELPELKPEYPWFGFSLGDWTEENQHEAELALQGRHYEVGAKLAQQRVRR
jgi:4-hydroxy-3-polyprenylbenzoate decarboxylase